MHWTQEMVGGYFMSRVCLRWDQLFWLHFCNLWGCMCWTGQFEFRWLKGYIYNPSYYHHQIGSTNLSHCCHIFPWLCVLDGCIIFCHLSHIYPGNTGALFPWLMFSLWYLQMIGYIGRVHLFADYTIWLSSLCRLIWRHWTTKMLSQVYAAGCVSKIKTILSSIFYLIYGAEGLQFIQFSCDDRENVYFIL